MAKEAGVYNLLIRDADWQDVIRLVDPAVYAPDGAKAGELYLLPGNDETRVIPMIRPNPMLLRDRLEELRTWADYVIFDTSPSASLIHGAV